MFVFKTLMINACNSWRWALIGRSWGIQSCTGYPVIIIVIIADVMEQAVTSFGIKFVLSDLKVVACILKPRNNEMIYLIAKYFL